MRPMLMFNHDAVLTAWAGARLGITDFRPCTTIGIAREGVILAAAIYNNYRPPNIEITFVTASPHWASKRAIRAMLRYPFVQLGCKRLTAITAVLNTSARTFLLRLGFCEEGLHSEALPTGAAVSYGLLAANAARWIA
jgi:RimJ/RimL family protein N-acetyltransferase